MGVRDMDRFLEQWQMEVKDLRRRMILAPTPRERERWYATLLLAQGWTASATAEALERDPHTIGRWASACGAGGPAALIFEQTGGSPRPWRDAADGVEGSGPRTARQVGHRPGQLELDGGAAVSLGTMGRQPEPQQLPELPAPAGVCLQAPQEAAGQGGRGQTGGLRGGVRRPVGRGGGTGAKIFFADEAHFRADARLRGKWVLKGKPALVDSSSPRYGEKASYYSAVCLETGEVEWMELEGNSNGESSVAFLEQLRERHGGRLNVIWDNALAHRGPAMRSYLETPGLNLRLVNLPGYSPDFNADEAIWGWARQEATGN